MNLKRLYSDVVDIWNPLCDLNWWSTSGTDSTGGILDADLRYEDFKRACEILPEADEFVDSLSDDEYKKYRYSPDLLAYDIYGSVQLDFITSVLGV